ncbi:hypothetical protein SAMN05421869_10194 [Nonomuraea jiangxiensis]|uniref:Uncharacterized protein n=1 Tax=Nonomuraea jiangxiensis TaxID=633440 RepID=A0A1G7YEW9_9ACTN|nr:hypothetical protein SAMN05421869_10194 [Nonomuraea jiangxiensis]
MVALASVRVVPVGWTRDRPAAMDRDCTAGITTRPMSGDVKPVEGRSWLVPVAVPFF